MIRKIGQYSAPLIPSDIKPETKTDTKSINSTQDIQPKSEKTVIQSNKDVVSLQGEILKSRLAKDLLKVETEKLSQESDAIAKAKYEDSSLNYNTGEAQTNGHPQLKPGVVVKIKINND